MLLLYMLIMWVFVNIYPVNVVVIHVNHFFCDLNFLYMQGINFREDIYFICGSLINFMIF